MGPGSKQDVTSKPAPQNGAHPPARQDPLSILLSDLNANGALFADLIGVDGESSRLTRFIAGCFSVARTNPKIMKCNPHSVMMAFGEAAALDLSPNPNMGEIYFVPRGNTLQAQVGYPGLIKLMNRGSEPIDSIHCDVVRRGDHWREIGGTSPRIEHEKPPLDEPLPSGYTTDAAILAAYAVVQLRGSSQPYTAVLRRDQLERAAERSGNPKSKEWSNVWREHFEEMAKKTALRRVAKRVPGSDDADEFVRVEEAREAGRSAGMARVTQVFQAAPAAERTPTQGQGGLDGILGATQDAAPLPPAQA